MPEVTTDKRFARVMKFLMASCEKKIARILMTWGFTDEDRKEGWELLDRAAGRHLAVTPGRGSFATQYRGIVGAVDDWENTWFDVAEAALARLSPKVHAVLFQNLSKTSGPEVVLNVRTFLERIDAMKKAEDDDNKSALTLLEKRGLTDGVLDEAMGLIEKIAAAEADDDEDENAEDEAARKAEREQAVEAMWAWYQDWAKTARTVVKNRNYQVMLGLLQHRVGGSSVDEGDDNVENSGT